MTAVTRTAAQATSTTGVAGITDANVASALGIITSATGRDLTDDDLLLRARDRRLIELAVDWQAAYVKENPGLLTREGNLTSASTNGNALSWGEGGSAAGLVSPLAEMSLKRLSWRRSRSIKMRRAKDRPQPQTLVHDGSDAEWVPLR